MEAGDFATRLEAFSGAATAGILVAAAAFALLGLYLTLSGKVNWLVFLLLCALNCSGYVFGVADTASTLARWFLLFAMASTLPLGFRLPGAALTLFGSYTALGIVCLAFATGDVSYQIQTAGVGLVTFFAAVKASSYVVDHQAAAKLENSLVYAAIAWSIPAFLSIPQFAASWDNYRFSGPYVLSTNLVNTGGMYLVIAAWGISMPWKLRWRIACAILTMGTLVCLAISGQRTGTFAGIIGCLPVLFLRRKILNIAFAAIAFAVGIYLAASVLMWNPERAEGILGRYSSLDVNGRDYIWQESLDKILQNPVLGHGFGSSHDAVAGATTTAHGMHNALLSIWYETGVVGLLCLLGAFFLSGFRCLRMIFEQTSEFTSNAARLSLGLLCMLSAHGLFTASYAKTSSISTIGLLVAFILVDRVWAMRKDPTSVSNTALTWVLATPISNVPRLAVNRKRMA